MRSSIKYFKESLASTIHKRWATSTGTKIRFFSGFSPNEAQGRSTVAAIVSSQKGEGLTHVGVSSDTAFPTRKESA